MQDFRYRTRKEYEDRLEVFIDACCWDMTCTGLDSVDYEELLDEYVEFCEVSGSGQ